MHDILSRTRLAWAAAVIIVAGAAAPGRNIAPTTTSTDSISAPHTALPSRQARRWRVTAREDVDLWLHGFAMLTSDTGHVPFFDRGYKQRLTALKRQRNVFTLLDANQKELSQRFATNPQLTNAQFLAMYFPSLQEIVTATDYFLRSGGNPRASSDPQIQREIFLLAQNFPAPADRTWLKLFVQSLQDEDTKFYHAYWTNEQQVRSAAFAQFSQLWTSQYYPKLSRFLNNTQQPAGELMLSLPLGGEGRTVNGSKDSNMVAVVFPSTADSAANALFGFVHEAVAPIVDEAIADNTTPAQQRSGVTIGYSGNGSVRGGAMLLQRVAPQLVAAYMRYYLVTAALPAPSGDPTAAFTAAFQLPAAILDAVGKQIDVLLEGI